MKTIGLFSGIGGLELPFYKRGHSATFLCENWDPARAVLKHRFPDIEIHEDITTLEEIPHGTELITAGFPCTDLSQAGRTAGIEGQESGLVTKIFQLLRKTSVECVVLENVRNMLVLDSGRAMTFLTSSLEELGYRWAYRLVDSRFSGVPQRRHRVILVACKDGDPRRVLFADNKIAPDPTGRRYRDDAYGFYWTEGLTGIGWVQDGVPPLKAGSSIGIPSPPGVWLPFNKNGEKIVTPSITAAERLQGFPAGWTRAAETVGKTSFRWKLVGNAVTVGVADWVAGRVLEPGDVVVESEKMYSIERWPESAFGENGVVHRFSASQWPRSTARNVHLKHVLDTHGYAVLSERASNGFLSRTERSSLRFDQGFIADMRKHVLHMEKKNESHNVTRQESVLQT